MQGASFLLAGFIFLAADLIQFVYQKKLKDRYSLIHVHSGDGAYNVRAERAVY